MNPKKIKYVTVFFLIIVVLISCKSKSASDYFEFDDLGITVEKFDKSNVDEDRFNNDNKIYTIGRKFTYSYYYENTNNQKFLISQGKEIQKEKYIIYDWEFTPIENQKEKTISKIILSVNSGRKPFEEYDYNQTVIQYDYLMNNGELFSLERTGAIENEKNLWIHPPRNQFFRILELNPFPYIKKPYKIGSKWNWTLKIGDGWSDSRWKVWSETIENKYSYEITKKEIIETNIGKLKCFVINGVAESEIGQTALESYYNEEYGFVKLLFTNIDKTKTVLELEKVE